jgi:tryptophan 2,3-dioxygenase
MNYWEYIHVEELLALQGGFDADESKVSNDEALFIVVHQIYELWFKIILRELERARDIFQQNPVPDVELASAVRSFRRVVAVFDQAVHHFRVMETLTTRDYLEFRDRLIPASGFQSAQLREIEILLGLDDGIRIPLGREGAVATGNPAGVPQTAPGETQKPGEVPQAKPAESPYMAALRSTDGTASSATRRVEARLHGGPSLKTVVYEWLARTPIDGPSSDQASADAFLRRFVAAHRSEIRERTRLAERQALAPEDVERLRARYEKEVAFAEQFLRAEEDPAADEETRAFRRRVRAGIVFLESYRELPRLSWPREVVDMLVELEQAMVIWRQRHARMVERVIGRRTGTGGSAGVDYLDQTALRYRIFGDVWAVRSLLLRKPTLPPLEREGDYGFRVED